MKLLRKIIAIFTEWVQPKHKLFFVDDLPNNVNDNSIYVVGERESPWLIAFNCPCGCHNLIQLNLLKEADPCWNYKVDTKMKINISPSIWRNNGCKSHFYVRNGKIHWVKSSYYQKK
jgi:hypothetical protein